MRVGTKAPSPAAQERGHLGALARAERAAPHGAAARRELGWLVHHYACTAPDPDKLERARLRLLAAQERALGPTHPALVHTLAELAGAYHGVGDPRAEALYRRALAVAESAFGSDDPGTAPALVRLGNYLRNAERYAEAEPLMRRVVAIEDARPGGGPRRRLGLSELAELYERWGRPAEAEPLWRRLVELAAQEGRARPPSVDPVALLADNLVLQGRHAEAEPLRRRALVAGDAWLAGSRARMTDPKFAPTVRLLEAMHDEQRAHQLHRLGDTLAALGRRAAAERCYGEALDLLARPTASEADPDFPLGGPGHRERSRAARRRQAADVLRAAAGLAHGSGHSGRAVALDAQVAAAEDEATTLDRAARERLAMPNESHGLGNFLARE